MPSRGPAIRLAFLLAALLVAQPPRAGEGRPRILGVAAATNLRPAMPALAKAFEQANPDVRVELTLGASGALYAKIRSGGPYDVFLSADRDLPGRLVEARQGGPEVVYAVGRLVMWTPPGSRLSLERAGLKGLAGRRVSRIAIANPAIAPYGRAAIAAFQAAGITQAIQGRIVLAGDDLRAAELAQRGGADVALLPASIAAEPALARGKAVLVPQALHPRIEQAGVVLRGATEPALAEAFLAFLSGRQGREILRRHRYEAP